MPSTFFKLSPTRRVSFAPFPRLITLPDPPAPGAITPAMVVSYPDTDGTPQRVSVVDNVTTITGVAPFSVRFFLGGTRSEQPDGDDDIGALWGIDYLMEYGDAAETGTWPYSGQPRGQDQSGTVHSHTYRNAGTFEARATATDSADASAFIRVIVQVTAPGAGVDLTPGVIPTWADDTVYNAPAGGTWGSTNFNGRSNIIIRKTGEGPDPVFGTITLDGRNEPNFAITRTRGIRFLNCDVANVTWGNVGFDNCTFVGGRVRTLSAPGMQYAADQLIVNSRTAQQAQNVRFPRGLFLHEVGEINPVVGANYVCIGEIRGLSIKGSHLNRTDVVTTLTEHNFRGIYEESEQRHNLITNPTTASRSYIKLNGWSCTVGVDLTDSGGGIPVANGVPDAWPESGMAIELLPDAETAEGARVLGIPSSNVCIIDNFLGSAEDGPTEANVGAGPENNDPLEPGQGCELVMFKRNNWYQVDIEYNASLTGRGLGMQECFFNSGAGAAVGVSAGVDHPRRTPDGWEGPYFT